MYAVAVKAADEYMTVVQAPVEQRAQAFMVLSRIDHEPAVSFLTRKATIRWIIELRGAGSVRLRRRSHRFAFCALADGVPR